ncbi:MATE family efflux transporter [uncultured Methanobrevibacter sp.]|uniref:MATE family efflux transporter n=1 Tax=uncultured Methanobrevibacter sp. TaxID=253161 RepID=UPI0025D4596B|nr:MATE family efflux transporter [uncultured Methanobrevibacter sp.]
MKNNVDFNSNPKQVFWQMTRPLLLLTFFEAGYSFVDVFWVSQMNAESFFAIGVAVPLVTLIISFGKSLGVGTNSIMSREIGNNNFEDSYNSILHGIIACLILGLVIILSTFFLKNILIYMGATSSMDISMQYLTPIFLCCYVFLFSNFFTSTLHAEGNTRTPTILLIITNVLNLILDPIFIFVLGWGASGVSYATILSSGITTIYLLYWYLSGKSKVTLNFKYFKPGIVYDIFIVAIPNFLTDSLSCISMLFFNKILIAQLGQIGILLYSTASRIESIMISPQKAFGRSLISISGHLFGAGRIDDLKDLYNYVLKKAIIIALISTIIFFFIREYGFALFSVTGASTSIFYIALAAIVIIPFNEISVMSGKVLDGMGKSYHTLFLTIGIILYEIIIVTLLSPIFKQGVCVLLGILIGEITFAIIYYILLKYIFKTKGETKIKDIIKTKKITSK